MDLLLNPNIAFLLLAGGVSFAILAIFNPGTGIFEIISIFALLLAGWEIYNLPVNWWALFLLMAGGAAFILAVRKSRGSLVLLLAILALVAGSAFLFRSDLWWRPAVNPFLAATVSLISGGFFWLAARKVQEAQNVLPAHELENLIGEKGEARSPIFREGSVQVAGELWTAHSEKPVPEGTRVRVIGREGFSLLVEPSEPNDISPSA